MPGSTGAVLYQHVVDVLIALLPIGARSVAGVSGQPYAQREARLRGVPVPRVWLGGSVVDAVAHHGRGVMVDGGGGLQRVGGSRGGAHDVENAGAVGEVGAAEAGVWQDRVASGGPAAVARGCVADASCSWAAEAGRPRCDVSRFQVRSLAVWEAWFVGLALR